MAEANNPHALPNQEKWIQLTRAEVKHIFIYYAVLFTLSVVGVGIYISIFSAAKSGQIGLILLVTFAAACGLMGSTSYYIRKLYKSCIQRLVDTCGADPVVSLGAKAYFYFRPLFGSVLAALVTLGIYGGFFVLQEQPTIIAERFYIFIALISFVVGFSNGKFIVKLDNSAEKIIEKIITKEGAA